jgi:hypothetical protein
MTKVTWFLDIDGVLNAFPDPPTDGKLEWKNERIAGFSIWYSPTVIDFINSAVESGLVEVRWLTTWEHMANADFAPAVGLKGPWEVMERKGTYPDISGWWKADLLQAWRKDNPDAPVIWTDDDITFFLGDDKEKVLELAGRNSMVVCPFTSVGLDSYALEKIGYFIIKNTPEES